MKRILKIFISFILVFLFLTPITSFAVEIAEEGGEVIYHTIFSRLWEFVEENKTEVVSGAGSILVLAVSAIIKVANSKGNKELKNQMTSLSGTAEEASKAQTSVIKAVNSMINGYNVMQCGYDEMRATYEQYQSMEDDRNRLIGAVMVQNTALLEIVSAVFIHNKNLPQGVKDLIVLQYANCQKALGDDAVLKAIVDSVREKINLEGNVEESNAEVSSEESEV